MDHYFGWCRIGRKQNDIIIIIVTVIFIIIIVIVIFSNCYCRIC